MSLRPLLPCSQSNLPSRMGSERTATRCDPLVAEAFISQPHRCHRVKAHPRRIPSKQAARPFFLQGRAAQWPWLFSACILPVDVLGVGGQIESAGGKRDIVGLVLCGIFFHATFCYLCRRLTTPVPSFKTLHCIHPQHSHRAARPPSRPSR
ncbi:hypothetical protein BC834DRAFT_692402 [Gloeopeniophorella convolvens]|nr:hypothetical protein BC834DRAFT_692402 [Gloeopeniophorella convolvens]